MGLLARVLRAFLFTFLYAALRFPPSPGAGGAVSDAEQAAYEKKQASDSTSGTQKPAHQKDPMHKLAHALHLLKAYADNGNDTDSVSVSVEA